MNGVTGRMGTNQHLKRSIVAIREAGGLRLASGDVVIPDPILVGRDAERLKALASECAIERWSTDLDQTLDDPYNVIYFDSQITSRRASSVEQALLQGKHVYCEKPLAGELAATVRLARLAKESGLKTGIVQDKLFLPGLLKLKALIDRQFFGRILSVRGEFGYWVFEGDQQKAQRPSWNYRKEDGGGITLDMFGHWQYVLQNLFGPVNSVWAHCMTHIPRRFDETGRPYTCTADDAVYAFFELEGGIVVQMNSSWAVRVYRDDLFTLQVDGTEGSAVAGLRECRSQSRSKTPRAVWNPDLPVANDYFAGWDTVPDDRPFENAFKMQWELFLRHVMENAPFPYDFLEAAKGVQLAELGLQSCAADRRVAVPRLNID